jgi:hypothetical protein
MFFAGNNGIYIFDGNAWDTYDFEGKRNFIIRSLDVKGDMIFYGGVGVFGYLSPNETGFKDNVISQKIDTALQRSFSDVWSLKVAGRKVVLTTDTIAFVYDISKDTLEILTTDKYGYTFVSVVDSKIYYGTVGKIYRFNPVDDKLDTFELKGHRIWHFLPYRGDTLLLLSPRSMLLYDFSKGKYVEDECYKQLFESIGSSFIYSADYLPEFDIYIFGTVKSGLYFVDTTARVIKHLPKSMGLISQTVQSLCVDKQGNLWAGTSMGISLLNLTLPFEIFDERNGLDGVPYSALVTDTLILFGTNVDLLRYDDQIEKFVPVHTKQGVQVQQIFTIDTLRTSD